MKTALGLLLALALGWFVFWSLQGQGLRPVRVGIDVCSVCGMIVSEKRYSISILDQDSDGHKVTRHFDDAGCFLTDRKNRGEQAGEMLGMVGVAHDYRNGKEIPLKNAKFIRTDEQTPMGSGMVAVEREPHQGYSVLTEP